MKQLNAYLREIYGCKVYKISLQAQVTCPNRDGTLDTRGCIFCSAGGSGEFAADVDKSIPEQIEEAKQRIAAKVKGDVKYITYFQSYTNTYGDEDYLHGIFQEAMAPDDVVALSIGTRPDSITERMYGILEELNRVKPVWVELGLQTIHPDTARYIRRGYELSVYDDCTKRLRGMGITVVTHVILGFPGETTQDMIATVDHVVATGANGIKLQLLHVLKGTDLEQDYYAGRVNVMTLEEYLNLLREILPHIPDDVIIHRLTGDGPKRLLIAPLWTGDKKRVINAIQNIISQMTK